MGATCLLRTENTELRGILKCSKTREAFPHSFNLSNEARTEVSRKTDLLREMSCERLDIIPTALVGEAE